MSEWQPIETAPMDGSIILLYQAGEPEAYVGWYDKTSPGYPWRFLDDPREVITGCCDRERTERIEPNGYLSAYPPTHWMPIPKPPVQS